jgi:ribosomal protein S18 acetylase RimI-like enzyme
MEQLQSQILGLPMLDSRSIMLAFDNDTPVGYVHTAFAPDDDKHFFDFTIGHICFLCVDAAYSDASGAAAALIRAGEDHLSGKGAQVIFGGSPSPSVPFYTAFYSGGEACGILHSDETVINAFHAANYHIHQATTWFHFDLQNYAPADTAETVGYFGEFEIEIHESSKARTWWEGCALAQGIWFDATAFLARTNRPIARLRTRITYPDAADETAMYGKTWLASLVELRVHPSFDHQGIKKYLLDELIRYLVAQNQIAQIEAHTAENSPLFTLLRSQSWLERNTGTVFIKNVVGARAY